MSMKSFKDILGAVASSNVTAPSAVPYAAPILESLLAQTESQIVEHTNTVQPAAAPVAAKTTGFSAMLQRIAGPATPVVSVLDESVATPVAPAPETPVVNAIQVNESILGTIASSIDKHANRLDGISTHDDLHQDVHHHLAKAADAIAKAHSLAKEAHEKATDPTHKAHLEHVLGTLHNSFQGVSSAKEASNLGHHHYKASTGQLS